MHLRFSVACAATACAFLLGQTPSYAQAQTARNPERGGIGMELLRSGFGSRIAKAETARDLVAFDGRKSIFVTDQKAMEKLTFADVMQQLASQSSPPVNKSALFKQWWDTAAAKPGKTGGPHCDDEAPADGDALSKRNGFPFRCPRPEAGQPDPFANPSSADGYSAIAYSNRFDLAAPDGANCGEYRVVFARNSGKANAINRNLIILEALVPNPSPKAGIDGCRPILEFWLSLSQAGQSSAKRGERLRDFYLNGLPAANVGPVIHIENFAEATGQIRTNQFMQQPIAGAGFEWTLREFKIAKSAGGITIVPSTVNTNPGTDLFLADSQDTRTKDFVQAVISKLDDLRGAGDEASTQAFKFENDDKFNSFESNENEGKRHLGDVLEQFNAKQGGPLRDELDKALNGKSTLTAENIIRRVRTQTCAGCHRFSNGDQGLGTSKGWPSSIDFVHQSEQTSLMEQGPDGPGTRFAISQALKDEFIPFRAKVMTEFLSKFSSAPANK